MTAAALWQAPVVPPVVASALLRMGRAQIETLVSAGIDRLDQIDGDADDYQANGDEFDGNLSEEDFINWVLPASGPGCPVGDPDATEDRF